MSKVIMKNESSDTQYKFSRSEKIRNIKVVCNYFANKNNITFRVIINIFKDRKNEDEVTHCFEMYGNTQNSTYNYICVVTKDDDLIPLTECEEENNVFKNVLDLIKREFDPYTKNFISCATKLIESRGEVTKTPQFIKNEIQQFEQSKVFKKKYLSDNKNFF